MSAIGYEATASDASPGMTARTLIPQPHKPRNQTNDIPLDLDALTAELESQRLFAIIDVADPVEPLPPEHPLRTLPNAVLTPHIAGSQGTELARMSEWVVDEVERYATGVPLRNPVTREMVDRIA